MSKIIAHKMNVDVDHKGNLLLDKSIYSFSNGSFYDHSGSIHYKNITHLLAERPELAVEGIFKPEYRPSSKQDFKKVTFISQLFKQQFQFTSLDDYLPFYNYERIRSNVGTTDDGNLTIMMWRPTLHGARRGEHYGACQFRGGEAKWTYLKGCDSKCVEGMTFNSNPIYVVFGAGDFVLLKSLGINFLGFLSDGAIKNTPHEDYIKSKVGKRIVRIIADNDESGHSVIFSFLEMKFDVEVFNWSLFSDAIAKDKADLRDLAYFVKANNGDFDDLVNFVTNDKYYEKVA